MQYLGWAFTKNVSTCLSKTELTSPYVYPLNLIEHKTEKTGPL